MKNLKNDKLNKILDEYLATQTEEIRTKRDLIKLVDKVFNQISQNHHYDDIDLLELFYTCYITRNNEKN